MKKKINVEEKIAIYTSKAIEIKFVYQINLKLPVKSGAYQPNNQLRSDEWIALKRHEMGVYNCNS